MAKKSESFKKLLGFLKKVWSSKAFFIWAVFLVSLGGFAITTPYQTANDKTTKLGITLLDFNSKYNTFISTSNFANIINELTKGSKVTTNSYPQDAYKSFLELVPFLNIPIDEFKDKRIDTYEMLSSITKEYYSDFSSYNKNLQASYSLQTSAQDFWYKLLIFVQVVGFCCALRLVFFELESLKTNMDKQNQTNKPS